MTDHARSPEGKARHEEGKRASGRGRTVTKAAEKKGTLAAIGALQEALAEHGVDLSDLGSVRSIRVNDWEALKKGPTEETIDPKTGKVRVSRGATEKVPMHSSSITLTPAWETGPKWPVVQPADPVTIKAPKAPRGPSLVGTWKTLAFIPDAQIGYRRLANGTLDPFHDPRAIDLVLQVVEAERPDGVIHSGDFEDFAPFSRHRHEPGFEQTVQAGVQYGYEFLALLRELVREYHRVVSGNHDIRLQNWIIDNARAAFGLTRAQRKDTPKEWPVLSLENLLHFEELGIEYVGAYPAGATYVNDNLAVIHGSRLGNRTRSTAQVIVEDERVSILHGHSHKRATAAKTRNSRGKPRFSVAHSPGCVCRIDGAVPSVKGQIDAFGAPVKSWEDWQQGMTIVRYEEGNGRFALEEIPFFEGWAMHRGQEFTSERAVNDPTGPGA